MLQTCAQGGRAPQRDSRAGPDLQHPVGRSQLEQLTSGRRRAAGDLPARDRQRHRQARTRSSSATNSSRGVVSEPELPIQPPERVGFDPSTRNGWASRTIRRGAKVNGREPGNRSIPQAARHQPPARRMRPAGTSLCPPTSRPASTTSRVRRRTWPSTSSITSTKSPSRPPRSWRAGPTRRVRPSCASARRSASKASPSCRVPRARSTAVAYKVATNGHSGATRRCSRWTRTSSRLHSPPITSTSRDGAQGVALRRGRSSCDRRRRPDPDRRNRPDGVLQSYLRHLLMLLDLRAETVASPSQEALSRLGRRRSDARHRASAGRPHPLAGDETRPPQGADRRDHRRDVVGGRQARADQALLLVNSSGCGVRTALLAMIQRWRAACTAATPSSTRIDKSLPLEITPCSRHL